VTAAVEELSEAIGTKLACELLRAKPATIYRRRWLLTVFSPAFTDVKRGHGMAARRTDELGGAPSTRRHEARTGWLEPDPF
jgi:hypothetical protein